MLNEDETATMTNRAQSTSRAGSDSGQESVSKTSRRNMKGGRMMIGMDDGPSEKQLWPSESLGPSGRLPGVYQNVRAAISRLSGLAINSYVAVPPRTTLPISPHHLHLTRPPHSRPPPNQIPRPHRRPSPRSRRHPRRPLPRDTSHRQSLLGSQRHGLRRRQTAFCPRLRQTSLDPLHAYAR